MRRALRRERLLSTRLRPATAEPRRPPPPPPPPNPAGAPPPPRPPPPAEGPRRHTPCHADARSPRWPPTPAVRPAYLSALCAAPRPLPPTFLPPGALHVLTPPRPVHRAPRRAAPQAGSVALPLFGAYAASKHALEAMSDALRYELRDQGIQARPRRCAAVGRCRARARVQSACARTYAHARARFARALCDALVGFWGSHRWGACGVRCATSCGARASRRARGPRAAALMRRFAAPAGAGDRVLPRRLCVRSIPCARAPSLQAPPATPAGAPSPCRPRRRVAAQVSVLHRQQDKPLTPYHLCLRPQVSMIKPGPVVTDIWRRGREGSERVAVSGEQQELYGGLIERVSQ